MSRITKGVVLAGGLGRRLMPLTRAIPKEMLPLGTKPVIEHIVDDLKGAGLASVLIVTRKEKMSIAKHFSGDPVVEIVNKDEALGPGHSVLAVGSRLEGESFVLAFGDAPIGGPRARDLIPALIETHDSFDASVVTAVTAVSAQESHLRGIVELAHEPNPGEPTPVVRLLQKPDPSETRSRWAVAGRYTFSPAIFDALREVVKRTPGEILLADAIALMLARGQRMYTVTLSDEQRRFDTGSFHGYAEAFRYFSESVGG